MVESMCLLFLTRLHRIRVVYITNWQFSQMSKWPDSMCADRYPERVRLDNSFSLTNLAAAGLWHSNATSTRKSLFIDLPLLIRVKMSKPMSSPVADVKKKTRIYTPPFWLLSYSTTNHIVHD